MSDSRTSKRSTRWRALLVTAALGTSTVLAGCASEPATPVLTWYINADGGGQEDLAEKCTARADGRYRIEIALLPREATDQREQLVRRLAANDSGIDLMSLDVPYLAEFANAGFVRKFSESERSELTQGMLQGPLEGAEWEGDLYAVPFNTNTQLLWVRQSVADEAGLDLDRQLTWSEVIEAAEETGTTVQIQGQRYEGYTTLINSLVASAGGEILRNPEAGRDVKPGVDSEAGRAAAEVIEQLASSEAAPANIANSNETTTSEGFLGDRGGFQVNWPFVYTAARDGDPDLFEDFAWTRWPAVREGEESRPPLGGINLAIGAFSEHPEMAVDAASCITEPDSQAFYMRSEGLLPTVESVYQRPRIQQEYPMADLLSESLEDAAPRPVTPFYPDVTEAVQRTWHPQPVVDPDRTPAESADLIVNVLQDKELL